MNEIRRNCELQMNIVSRAAFSHVCGLEWTKSPAGCQAPKNDQCPLGFVQDVGHCSVGRFWIRPELLSKCSQFCPRLHLAIRAGPVAQRVLTMTFHAQITFMHRTEHALVTQLTTKDHVPVFGLPIEPQLRRKKSVSNLFVCSAGRKPFSAQYGIMKQTNRKSQSCSSIGRIGMPRSLHS
eukprot:Gregarina_sp_Poly_1__11028@NODE_87_length_15225_cov_52_775630_g75_i0_p6_GENE_NODE_87_length_15225_cov_52_775630_g75_i0NODE_87_length_15225_cov_52_775630_g75_i0_p6_ORF_typecomplete_len180_score4_76Antistasin/PF02822_14/1_3Antistasin/PF02822_14/4_2e02_NODE_87_length_15225_cov_52_775630_g75_i069137452